MKRFFSGVLILLLAVSQVNCERDDICAEDEPTTPRIVMDVYDYSTGALRNVTNMTIRSTETDSVTTFNGTSKLYIPLKTFDTSTTYTFTINDDENPNTATFADTITFTYGTREIYVSRACGYKTVFDLSQEIGVPAVLMNNGTPGTWIRNIIIDTHTIETENETHIRIFY